MTSKADLDSGKYTVDEPVLIDFYGKFRFTDRDAFEKLEEHEPNFNGVRVCPVPRSFSSAKPEAFTPQFVGLGPYHHFSQNLPKTDEMKLGVAKRVLKVPNTSEAHEHLQNLVSDIEIQAFYHMEDDHNTCDSGTLLYVLTVDGLFLLGLLHSGAMLKQRYSSYFILTGKHFGMPPVNAFGVELSLDGITRDVFMLENQIPTIILKQISRISINNDTEIESSDIDNDLGSVMLNFCIALSPLLLSPIVHSPKLLKDPEAHDHLLDLMYYLIAPEPQPEREPEPKPKFKLSSCLLMFFVILLVYVLYPLCLVLWTFLWIFAYGVVVFVQPFLQLIRFVLVKVIPWSGAILNPPKMKIPTLPYFLSSIYDLFLYDLSSIQTFLTFPIYHIFKSHYTKRRMEAIRQWIDGRNDSLSFSYKGLTIPSATELYNAKIQFKPVESDISSIKFDEINREFYLPCIKLDATSEVILRNLVVYESLIKRDRLNFISYIELMRGLIHTTEDVKLLVDNKIIQTQLNAQVVTQIFNMPMGELIGRPTEEIQKLEEQLKKVKPKFDEMQNLYLIFNEFVRFCAICIIVVVFSPVLVQAIQQVWCSTIFGNYSESYCKRHQVGDYGRNNYYISSM